MKEPDSSIQLPLPAVTQPPAQVVKLPRARHLPALPRSLPRPPPKQPLRPTLWYALYFPQLATLDEVRQQQYLKLLAGLVESISSTVSYQPLALVCEIRSSLKYFGGMNAIHDKLSPLLKQQLEEWQLTSHFSYAASPTVTGSLLLARSGHNVLVYQRENLRSALGKLSTEVLHLNKEQNRRLYNMGVRFIRDIWRLPADGLRKRFGSEFINQLNRALGKAPEPTRNYVPPPAFKLCFELPYEIELMDRLLPVADEMFAQLCDFLQRRDLSCSQLECALLHEKRAPTTINLGLRQPSRSRAHLLLLLETHFSSLQIPAPVIAIRIAVKKFDAFMGHNQNLLTEGRQRESGSQFNQFMEQLQARLGDHAIHNITTVAEHCPEYASATVDHRQLDKSRAGVTQNIALNQRPLWLLPEPRQLTIRRGRLYHRKPVHIISGPERIETRWWSGTDVQRDYYVAQEADGSRLWIYRERAGEARNWYLHGVFS